MDQKFKRLQERWYQKLAESGFKDIEKNGLLRVYHDSSDRDGGRLLDPIKNEARRAYYDMASEFLYTHKFKDELERGIWEMHSQGNSVNQIKAQLKARGIVKGRRQLVSLIQHLRNTMRKKTSS